MKTDNLTTSFCFTNSFIRKPQIKGDYTARKIRLIYALSSLIALSAGFLCYYFFRDSNLIFYNIFNINMTHNNVYIAHNVFTDFLKYNLCDGLWLVSSILLLRCIWFGSARTGNYYTIVFIGAALLLEMLQLTAFFPGTFDIADMAAMAIFALLERCIYFYTSIPTHKDGLAGGMRSLPCQQEE